MYPIVALVTAGDLHFSDAERNAVVQQLPLTPQFKWTFCRHFYKGIPHKSGTTFSDVSGVLTNKI